MHFHFAFPYYSRAGVIDGSRQLLFRSNRQRRKSEPFVFDKQLGWSFATCDAKFLLNCNPRSLQRLEQSFDFAPNEIANGAKFFRRGSAAPPDDANKCGFAA